MKISEFDGTLHYQLDEMFQSDPAKRPTIDEMLRDDFMTVGYMPNQLPTSCLTMAPRFDTKANQSLIAGARGPLQEINKDVKGTPFQKARQGGSNQL